MLKVEEDIFVSIEKHNSIIIPNKSAINRRHEWRKGFFWGKIWDIKSKSLSFLLENCIEKCLNLLRYNLCKYKFKFDTFFICEIQIVAIPNFIKESSNKNIFCESSSFKFYFWFKPTELTIEAYKMRSLKVHRLHSLRRLIIKRFS